MNKPRLLDAFSGAGGAGMGYHRAGFEVVGVDIAPQPRYPFTFVQGDAIAYIREHGHEFDAIHASPPCQAYSQATKAWPTAQAKANRAPHPKLIDPTREALNAAGVPWVIENVPGAPLNTTVVLCGVMFGLKVYRHRLFESNVMLIQPPHARHPERVPLAGRGASSGGYISVAGHFSDVAAARRAMGIDWMTRDELSQAIPPAYCQFLGHQLMAYVRDLALAAD